MNITPTARIGFTNRGDYSTGARGVILSLHYLFVHGSLPHALEDDADVEPYRELVVELSALSGRLDVRVELHQRAWQRRLRHRVVHETG